MNFLFDLKYAWRLLKKSWGYSLMCATVVALSVGLSVWTYWLAYVQVWQPLAFADSDRWYSVQIAADAAATARPVVDAYTYQELLKHNRSADYLGAFGNRFAVLGEGQASTSLRAAVISPRLFAVTRVAPRLGRVFGETDASAGAAPAAILSFATWQTYFAADPKVIGRSVRIDAAPVQVIGVMPENFLAFQDFEIWMPLQMPRVARPGDSAMTLSPLITMDKSQNRGAVLKEMNAAVDRVNRDYPDLFKQARHVKLIPAARMLNHGNTPIVATIGFLGAAVLLLGCVNISMVFLARLLERSRELALRTALGASRSRLLRQCLLETAMIVLVGLVVGYGLAFIGVGWAHGIGDLMTRVMASGRDSGLATLRPIHVVAAVMAAIAIWLLSTLIPAWRVAKRDAAMVLAGSGKGTAGRSSNRGVALLVGVQVVVSCLVLVICGSLVLAINKEVRQPSGVNSERVMLTTAPTVFDARFSEASQRLRYWEDLKAGIESKVPGAEAAFMTASPTRPARVTGASIESQQGTEKQGALTLPLTVVSDNYFEILGLQLRSGRLFDTTDNSDSLNVAVVDEQTAARYWPEGDVLGKRIQLQSSNTNTWLTVVGVVSAVAGRPYRTDEVGVIYRPLRQAAPAQFHLLVKLPDATDQRAALRAAAFDVDRDLPLHNLQTLDDYLLALSVSYTAMIPVLIAVAIITAMLAASGLFGLISRSVAQRTQEVGIRRALGATPWRSTSMFRHQGAAYLSVSIVGVALGIIVMSPLSRIFTNIFDHVVPVTLGVVVLMAAVIFTASYLPTRRAVALEPGDALRYE